MIQVTEEDRKLHSFDDASEIWAITRKEVAWSGLSLLEFIRSRIKKDVGFIEEDVTLRVYYVGVK